MELTSINEAIEISGFNKNQLRAYAKRNLIVK